MAPTHSKTAFHACSTLGCLLSNRTFADNPCGECKNDIYVSDGRNFVHKQRSAKPSECRTPSNVVWELSTFSKTAKHKKRRWTPDSGANISVTNDHTIFHTITDISPGRRVRVANKQFVDVVQVGTVQLCLKDKRGTTHTFMLEDVLYSPHFSTNLLSVEQVYKQHRLATTFRGSNGFFVTPDGVELPFSNEDRKYVLHTYSAQSEDSQIWHRRFLHRAAGSIQKVANCTHLPGYHVSSNFQKCDACLQGGAHKLPVLEGVEFKRRKDTDRANRAHQKRLRFTFFGQRLSIDLCGPMPKGANGELYLLIIHDSYSTYICTHALMDKTKESILDALRLFISDYNNYLTRGIGQLHSDNGSEFVNSDMERFCEDLAIKITHTIPYLPVQNPYAERANGTILRPLRILLAEAHSNGSPNCDRFWPILAQQAALIHNIIPDSNCVSPYKQVLGNSFDVRRLHVPLTLCYYLLPEKDRISKLSPRAVHAIYLGIDPVRNGHHVYIPSSQKITSAFHVVFNEHRYYDSSIDKSRVIFDQDAVRNDGTIAERVRRRSQVVEPDDDIDQPRTVDGPQPHHVLDPVHGTLQEWNENHCSHSRCLYPSGHLGPHSYEDEAARAPRRTAAPDRLVYSTCERDKCTCYAIRTPHTGACVDEDGHVLCDDALACSDVCSDSDDVLPDDANSEFDYMSFIADDVANEILQINLDALHDIPCPKTYADVGKSPLKDKWNESMRSEIEALLRNGTWDLVSRNDKRLRGRKPTKSRWVYTVKFNRDNTIEKLKSRFVVCGYSQRAGYDYDRTFSATMRATTFRTLLAIAAGKKMRLRQLDVSNAFTQATMDDVDLFVEPAPGFEVWETINGKRVSKLLHLKKALYGTKQASRLWQDTLRAWLVAYGFVQSSADPCVYRMVREDGEIILGIYVDDIVVAYRGDDLYEKFETDYFKRFPGHAKRLQWFLGMAIDQHDDFSIHIDHSQSIQKIGEQFIPNNTVTRECPGAELFNTLDRPETDTERAKAAAFPYSNLVGALLYIACMSRPDATFYVSILAKFLSDPSLECCKAATHLLQYLVSTRNRKMYISGKIEVPTGLSKFEADVRRNCGFVAYSDSSWGNKYPYPMFGYGIYLFGGLISYASKQLKTVAFSSCEAEYAAASYACKEVEFVRMICADMGVTLRGRLVLALDNTACIDIAHDVGVSARTKHFDRAIHYLRDLTQLKRILPCYVTTLEQRADGYTKALDKSKFAAWSSHVVRA